MTDDILLVGSGALATLFAARLASAGTRVTMLGTWGAGIQALRAGGARLVQADGHEQSYQVAATTDPADCRGATNALVLVKSWQTARAARQLKECLAPDGLALTLQNGLGNREALEVELGGSRVALGTTTAGAALVGPGLVRPGGEGKISLEANPAVLGLQAALRAARFNVETVADARTLVWGKLVINAAINPLTALLRVENGELLKRSAARELMHTLADEAAQVARAAGVSLPFEDPRAAVEEVAGRTAANRSSMLQDVERGAPTEIDAICGAVVRIGAEHAVDTPANRTCWQLVKALEVPYSGPAPR
jgi:2-dehydropantoate 2-reductase